MEVTGANLQRHLETSLGKGETFFVVAQNAGRILLLATLSKCIFSPQLQVYNRTADYIRASMERFMKHRKRKQWSGLQLWCNLGVIQFSWSLATCLEKKYSALFPKLWYPTARMIFIWLYLVYGWSVPFLFFGWNLAYILYTDKVW